MGDAVEDYLAQFRDAVAAGEVDIACRLLSRHLGYFAKHDLDATRTAVGELSVRLAFAYPAVAIFHPRRHELARLVPADSALPGFVLGDRDESVLRVLAVMVFARESGRIKLAQRYADRIAQSTAVRDTPAKGAFANIESEWLTWFECGKTRLAAGQLGQSHRDLISALTLIPRSGTRARLTLGYLGLVAALKGETTPARDFLDRAQNGSTRVGGYLWSLDATARAILEVEEHTPASDNAVDILDRVEDAYPFWPFILLAKTRHAEMVGRPLESLSLIESADMLYSSEIGSFASDVATARRIEVLILLARLSAARSVYESQGMNAPHCLVAHMALLFSEHDFNAVDRQLDRVLIAPNVTSAQRAQVETFSALGYLVRDGAIPDHVAPGIGRALSIRAHRRVALMFPQLLCDALEPYLSAELLEDWRPSVVKTRLWLRGQDAHLRSLTPRQVTMLRHLDQGRSYVEIADIEHVSINTVKAHLKVLYRRLGASSASDALVVARQWGVLDSLE